MNQTQQTGYLRISTPKQAEQALRAKGMLFIGADEHIAYFISNGVKVTNTINTLKQTQKRLTSSSYHPHHYLEIITDKLCLINAELDKHIENQKNLSTAEKEQYFKDVRLKIKQLYTLYAVISKKPDYIT